MELPAKEAAQTAIFERIAALVGELEGFPEGVQVPLLKDLAATYRFAAGGAQPGSSVIDRR